MDFTVLVNHIGKLKESEKKNEYLDLTRELKKLWKEKVAFILMIIDALGTFSEELIKELEDLEIRWRVETIQTTALLRSARKLWRVLDTWGDLQWKTIS